MLFRLSCALPAARAPRRAALFFFQYTSFSGKGEGGGTAAFSKKEKCPRTGNLCAGTCFYASG